MIPYGGFMVNTKKITTNYLLIIFGFIGFCFTQNDDNSPLKNKADKSIKAFDSIKEENELLKKKLKEFEEIDIVQKEKEIENIKKSLSKYLKIYGIKNVDLTSKNPMREDDVLNGLDRIFKRLKFLENDRKNRSKSHVQVNKTIATMIVFSGFVIVAIVLGVLGKKVNEKLKDYEDLEMNYNRLAGGIK